MTPAAAPSLRRRFLRLLLAPLLVLFGISGAACYTYAVHYANSVYDGWLYDSANFLALLVQPGERGASIELSPSLAKAYEWDVADTTYYRVSGARSGLMAGRADLPEPPDSAADYGPAKVFDARVDHHPVRVVVVSLPQARYGEAVTVEVAETETKRRILAREILAGVLAPQIVLIGAAVLILWFGIRGGLSPLGVIARRLEAQDLRQPQPIPAATVPREVQPLTSALNDLLVRLDAALRSQRRFVADAAHQLRTPLTALKLNIDEVLHGGGAADADWLRNISRSVERMARLSNQLLLLARAEPGASLPFERIELRALAAETGAEWVPAALRKNIELSLSAPEDPVYVRGVPLLLSEAINNLLDNAIKYHPGGGRVALELTAGTLAWITVSDDGPGIPAAQHEDALKRFHRVDRSGSEGSGLGLAIVQEIVRSHGGALALGSGLDGRGLSVRIELPRDTTG